MKKPGIHFRILFATFILISATTFALGSMGVTITRKFMLSRFEERISFLARYLALNTELGILIGDRVMLKTLAENLLSAEDVTGVTILDSSGEKLANISKKITSPLNIVEAPVLLKEFHDESLAFSIDTGSGAQRKELIGKVLITYSTRSIDNLLKTMKVYFIWLSAGLAALAGLIFYFISRSLVAPVTELAQEARLVASGDINLRARPGSLPETKELALAFNAMLDSLERGREELAGAREEMARKNSLAEMGKFSLMIAHEVKNPLAIIKSSLDLLKEDREGSTSSAMIGYIEDEIKRLNTLIEEFLSFAKPARPSFRFVDGNALLRDIVSRFELQMADTSLEIWEGIPASSCHVYADPDLLTRAIGNILKNAFEANADNGSVRVIGSCRDKTWIVEIEDEGEGIPRENIQMIFEPFFTTRSKGTGLGLTFASHVIKAHGGIIKAENREEGGARFRVELPIHEEAKGEGCEV
jgi:signal transduction histidine kinase